jgi:hypothetical protein
MWYFTRLLAVLSRDNGGPRSDFAVLIEETLFFEKSHVRLDNFADKIRNFFVGDTINKIMPRRFAIDPRVNSNRADHVHVWVKIARSTAALREADTARCAVRNIWRNRHTCAKIIRTLELAADRR